MNWSDYHRATRSATYGFLSVLPLVVMYEASIIALDPGATGAVRVGAEVWLKQLLALIGGTGWMVLGALVLVIGGIILFVDRKREIPIRLRYLSGMIAESAVYAVVVASAVSVLVGALVAWAPPQRHPLGVGMQLVLSIGAGVYEELLFRVLLVGGLYILLRRPMGRRGPAYVTAALVGAGVFSAVHYIGAFGDAFTVASFAFRFFFGLALNVLFLTRGFGVAAWTHALYDVFLVVGLLG